MKGVAGHGQVAAELAARELQTRDAPRHGQLRRHAQRARQFRGQRVRVIAARQQPRDHGLALERDQRRAVGHVTVLHAVAFGDPAGGQFRVVKIRERGEGRVGLEPRGAIGLPGGGEFLPARCDRVIGGGQEECERMFEVVELQGWRGFRAGRVGGPEE